MSSYQKAFLFNGICTKPELLCSKLVTEDYLRYEKYKNEIFQKYNLRQTLSENKGPDHLIAGALSSAISDRVVFESYIRKGIIPDVGCGYSSGVVNVCACFSAISYDTSYDIIRCNKNTAESLKNSGKMFDMGIIIGLDHETVNQIIIDSDKVDKVFVGSVNSEICVMITGYEECVADVLKAADSEGALKTVKMNIGIAYHTALIKPYAGDYIDMVSQIDYKKPDYPVVSVFSGEVMTTPGQLRYENEIDVTTAMRWDRAIKALEELGVTEFYDTSADGAIKKFSRLKKRTSKIYTYKDVQNMEV